MNEASKLMGVWSMMREYKQTSFGERRRKKKSKRETKIKCVLSYPPVDDDETTSCEYVPSESLDNLMSSLTFIRVKKLLLVKWCNLKAHPSIH